MWSTRPATTADREALIALCHASVGPDDYVPAFVDEFLDTGVILVAEDRDRIIGMVVYHDVFDGSAWLHAARTHPEYRRQGVATVLMAGCEALSRRHGRTAMRLWASMDNVASVNANRKYGYRERARFTRMRVLVSRPATEMALEVLDPAEWRRIASSPLLERGGGYLFHDFYFVPWTRSNARWLSDHEALWRFGPNAVSISEDFEAPGGTGLQIQLLAGDPSVILRALPSIARARGADHVESFLPHDRRLLEMAKRAGFAFMDWGQEAVLFEKRLPVRGGASGTGPRKPAVSEARRGASARPRARRPAP